MAGVAQRQTDLAGEAKTEPAAIDRSPAPAVDAAGRSLSRHEARRPEAEPRRLSTVLVIDADAVSRRFVELALGRDPELQVEGAVDGAGALEILSRTPVHVILAETELGDMNGLQFFRRLTQESRLRSVPFVFLTADNRVATKRVCFGAGVDDYLTKPCDGVELLARVKALIARQRRMTKALRSRGYTLAGDFSALSFPDLIAILELGRKSGTVSVASDDVIGSVYLDQGRVVHAVFGNLMGASAFVWMMAREDGHFEFTRGACPIDEPRRTITQSAQSLMMESARVIDTEKASGTNLAVQLVGGGESPAVKVVEPDLPPGRAPAYLPEPGAASQLEQSVRDSFTLGDLMIFTREELARWTATIGARERLHVLMVADLTQGVSAMLGVAGAPSERWVLGSMAAEAKMVGLSFFLRRERLIDVLLLDVRDPGVFRESLRRTPSLIIVAPPDGDALALGIKARVELALLVSEIAPRAVLGLGNPSLEGALRALGGGFGPGVPMRCLRGALGEPTSDLRGLVAEGVRLCAGLPRADGGEGGT
jgi:CheY-like chemotaxis protein